MVTCRSWVVPEAFCSAYAAGCLQAEVDYGSPEQKGSDRGHLTKDAPSKDAPSKDTPSKDDLLDWEMLSRTPSPAPERFVEALELPYLDSMALLINDAPVN